MKRKTKVKKRIKLSFFEKVLYTFAILLLVSSPIFVVFTKATLSEINFQVEKEKKLKYLFPRQ